MKKIFLVLLISSCSWMCSSDMSDENATEIVEEATVNEPDNKVEMAQTVAKGIIKSIPSPLELTSIVKGSGVYFSKEMLNGTENAKNYPTSFHKALNLGIYGADLGCINVYEKTHLALDYISVVKDIADELKVGQFFDFTMLKRLASNNKNIDSLIYISTSGFEKMNDYLSEHDRASISSLILLGGWLESLYIATNLTSVDKTDDIFKNYPELIERIGEQKMVLNDMLMLLSISKDEPGFQELISDLNSLKATYDGVVITYTYYEPEMKEVNKELVVIDKSTSSVKIDASQLEQITNSIKLVRNKIIKGNA